MSTAPPPPKRPGIPLSERNNPDLPRQQAPKAAHCWVTGPSDNPGPHPGLVLAWQQRDGAWFAQVAWLASVDEPVLVTQWLAADLVRPA